MAKGRSQDFHPDELSLSLLYAGFDQFCSCGKDTILFMHTNTDKLVDGQSGLRARSAFAGEQVAEKGSETHLYFRRRLVLLQIIDKAITVIVSGTLSALSD